MYPTRTSNGVPVAVVMAVVVVVCGSNGASSYSTNYQKVLLGVVLQLAILPAVV